MPGALLETLHVLADRGGGHIEPLGGLYDAARSDHLEEYLDARERIPAGTLGSPRGRGNQPCRYGAFL
jgi:hypothetical protein